MKDLILNLDCKLRHNVIEHYQIDEKGVHVGSGLQRRLLYTARKMPFPLKRRDYLVEQYNAERDGSHVIVSRSIYKNDVFSTSKSKKKRYLRADVKMKGYLLRPSVKTFGSTDIIYVACLNYNSKIEEILSKKGLKKGLKVVVQEIHYLEEEIKKERQSERALVDVNPLSDSSVTAIEMPKIKGNRNSSRSPLGTNFTTLLATVTVVNVLASLGGADAQDAEFTFTPPSVSTLLVVTLLLVGLAFLFQPKIVSPKKHCSKNTMSGRGKNIFVVLLLYVLSNSCYAAQEQSYLQEVYTYTHCRESCSNSKCPEGYREMTGTWNERNSNVSDSFHKLFSRCPWGLKFDGDKKRCKCNACAPQYYDDKSRCKPCPNGKVKDVEGPGKCLSCPEGKVAVKGNCFTLCRPSEFSDDGLEPCNSCTAGKYSDTSQSTRCKDCLPGEYSDNAARSCAKCESGKYSSAKGSTECKDCAAGFIGQSNYLNTRLECQGPCLAGKYSNEGDAYCKKCRAGYYGNSEGQTSDTCSGPCLAGKYSDKGLTDCEPCPAGRYGDVNALPSKTCTGPCKSGKYSTVQATTCSDCDAGYYGRTESQTASDCTGKCHDGMWSEAGRISCTKCPAGRFGDPSKLLDSKDSCDECPLGKFSHESYKYCMGCDAGRYGLGASETRLCTEGCSAGYHGGKGSSTPECDGICPPGEYSEAGSSVCKKCSAGYFGSSDSIRTDPTCTGICEESKFSLIGSEECTFCDPGRERRVHSTDRCQSHYYNAHS